MVQSPPPGSLRPEILSVIDDSNEHVVIRIVLLDPHCLWTPAPHGKALTRLGAQLNDAINLIPCVAALPTFSPSERNLIVIIRKRDEQNYPRNVDSICLAVIHTVRQVIRHSQ